VGSDVSYGSGSLCRIDGVNECFTRTKHFDFYFTVQKVDQPDTYTMEGYAIWTATGPWTYISQPFFILLPIRDGKVIDYITFSPQSDVLNEKIPMQKTFSCPGGLDAAIILYRLRVTDQDGPI